LDCAAIPINIAIKLFIPESMIGFRSCGIAATLVAMPKATVNEDYCIVPAKHDIRTTWKLTDVEPVAKSSRMKMSPDEKFRFGVLALDRRHHAGSYFLRNDIRQVDTRFAILYL